MAISVVIIVALATVRVGARPGEVMKGYPGPSYVIARTERQLKPATTRSL